MLQDYLSDWWASLSGYDKEILFNHWERERIKKQMARNMENDFEADRLEFYKGLTEQGEQA